MRFMNEYDVERALRTFDNDDTPNLAYAAESVYRLMRWANANSDGWAYWPKPARSAARLMEMLDTAQTQVYNGTLRDVPKSDVTKALTPVKSFLTRQGVDHTLVVLSMKTEDDLLRGIGFGLLLATPMWALIAVLAFIL